jgi:uncharacterized protein
LTHLRSARQSVLYGELTPFILKELAERLVTKGRFTKAESQQVAQAVRRDAELVSPTPLGKRVCRDPDDDWVLATAVAGEADVIVTGDKDLLVLKRHQGIPIVTPRGFFELLQRKR